VLPGDLKVLDKVSSKLYRKTIRSFRGHSSWE